MLWVDAQLSPAIAQWLKVSYGIDAVAVRDLRLLDTEDSTIFFAAKTAGAIVMTKDADFFELLLRHGPPPQVVWITCGNTSNAKLKEILTASWDQISTLLKNGEPLIEVGGRTA